MKKSIDKMEAQLNYLDLLVFALNEHEKKLDRLVAKMSELNLDFKALQSAVLRTCSAS